MLSIVKLVLSDSVSSFSRQQRATSIARSMGILVNRATTVVFHCSSTQLKTRIGLSHLSFLLQMLSDRQVVTVEQQDVLIGCRWESWRRKQSVVMVCYKSVKFIFRSREGVGSFLMVRYVVESSNNARSLGRAGAIPLVVVNETTSVSVALRSLSCCRWTPRGPDRPSLFPRRLQ